MSDYLAKPINRDRLRKVLMTWLLRVDKPNHEALEKIALEVWKSKVLVFSDDLAV